LSSAAVGNMEPCLLSWLCKYCPGELASSVSHVSLQSSGARNLPAEWAESSDPYVTVEYDGTHRKSKCDEGTLPHSSINSVLSVTPVL